MNRRHKTAFLKAYGRDRLERASDEPEDVTRRRLRDSGQSPFGFLQDSVQKGDASVQVIGVCLDAQMLAYQNFPRVQRQRHYQEQNEKIATESLKIIWSNEDLWLPLVAFDWSATNALCYFAVLEGIDYLLLDWLGVKVAYQDHQWRGILLRSIITAHVMLARHDADKTLSTFLSAVQMREEAMTLSRSHSWSDQRNRNDNSQASHLSLFPAAVQINSALAEAGYHYTSAKLFDRYLSFMSSFEGYDALGREYQVCRLNLFFPRRPDDRPAVALLRKFSNNERTIFSQEANRKMERSLRNFILRTALVASHNGNIEDLRWIKSTFSDQFDATKIPDESPLANREHSAFTLDGGLLIRRVTQ